MPLNANGVSSDYGGDKLFLIEGNSLRNVFQPAEKAGEFQHASTMPCYGPTWIDQCILFSDIYISVWVIFLNLKIKIAFTSPKSAHTDN